MARLEDCLFCLRIYRGEYDSANSTGSCVNFVPLDPVTPGHKLFVPTNHVTREANFLYSSVGLAMSTAARHGMKIGEDYNLILNLGEDASQTIEHIHVHYVPRTPQDGLRLPWTPN